MRAENLVGQIDVAAEWAWARTQDSVGSLREIIASIKSKITPGVSRFVMEEIRDIKSELGSETLASTAKEFVALKPTLEKLDQKLNALIKAHKAMVGHNVG